MENDQYGNYILHWQKIDCFKDGLTYTYKLRKDAKWYTADGEEYNDSTRFVTGLKVPW